MSKETRNLVVGLSAWLLAAAFAAYFATIALQWEFFRAFVGLIALRITINLLLMGTKEIVEGKNGGSRVI